MRLPTGADVLVLGSVEGEGLQGAVVAAYGMAGPDVTGVDLGLADGTRVTATVQAGRWGAWWPTTVSTAELSRLVVTTDTGQRVVDPEQVSLTWDRPSAD